jgi:pyridoxal phosphate enzyme (YggS family)
MPDLIKRLEIVRGSMAQAAARAGRAVDDIELVAVSKTHPPESIMEALDAGQMVFGESRVQEAKSKIPLLPERARWHFVGHLQKNKIRHALLLNFELLHGVDSLPIAQEINRIAGEVGALPHVLIEVNVAAESTKFGFPPEVLRAQMEQLFALDRVAIEGLMCLPPPVVKAENSRKYFVALRELRDRLQMDFRAPLPRLSMGMSGDYGVAIEEGATLVRVGTAIFGERSGKTWKPQADSAFDD